MQHTNVAETDPQEHHHLPSHALSSSLVPTERRTEHHYGLWPLPVDLIDTVVRHSFANAEATAMLQQTVNDAVNREATSEPLESSSNAVTRQPWDAVNPASDWSFDFRPSPKTRATAHEDESIPISPKTKIPTQVDPGYWLPAFLEEETQGLSADASPDHDEADHGAQEEDTPTQESLVRHEYYGGGNYFLPIRSVMPVVLAREKLRGNCWPPEMLTPIVDQFEEGDGKEKLEWLFGMDALSDDR